MGRTRRGCGRCQCHRHQPPCQSVSDVKRSDWLVHKFHCLGQHFVACVLASTNTTPQRSIAPSDCDARWHPLPHTLRDALSQVTGLPLATSPVVCARLPVNIFVRSTKHLHSNHDDTCQLPASITSRASSGAYHNAWLHHLMLVDVSSFANSSQPEVTLTPHPQTLYLLAHATTLVCSLGVLDVIDLRQLCADLVDVRCIEVRRARRA